MDIRIYDDKKGKWQSVEARLYEGDSYILVGYGETEAEALEELEKLIEEKIAQLADIDCSVFSRCNGYGEKI